MRFLFHCYIVLSYTALYPQVIITATPCVPGAQHSERSELLKGQFDVSPHVTLP